MRGKNHGEIAGTQALPGIMRRTLVHNDQLMLCHFEFKQGSEVPLHNHLAAQIGYVVSGRVRFTSARHPQGFEVGSGDSYVFDPHEQHGAVVLEDSVLIEIFSPSRPEYA